MRHDMERKEVEYYLSLRYPVTVHPDPESGFVAEIEGHVRGFILGQLDHVREAATEVGRILILGIHPDYQRRGIATQLVNAVGEKFHSKGIRRVHIDIDSRDKELVGFIEHTGFGSGHLVEYSKTI